MGERDVGAVRRAAGAVVLVPAAVDGDLELVATGREVERALPDLVPGIERQLGLVAGWIPVAAATHLGVQRPGDADRRRLGDRPAAAATASARRRRVADGGVGLGHREVAAVVAQHGSVLDERASSETAHVVEQAVRGVVVGAERRPLVRSCRAPRQRDLVESVGRDGHTDLGAAADRAAGTGRAEEHRRRMFLGLDVGRGAPHERAQRRHGDRHAAFAIACDVAGAGGPQTAERAVAR